MADRLVEQDEIEGLAQTADECDALLLPERELIDRGIPLIGDTRSLEHSPDLLLRLEMRELVFQADILRDGQFAEKTQILEKHTQRPAAQAAPRRGGKAAAIRPVEEYPPRVILPDAVEKVAQRSFPRSRSSLEQAVLPLAEGHLLQPDPRISRSRFPREHAGQHPLQSYRFHTFFISR